MPKPNVFCERCGARQPADPQRPGSRFSRMLDTVGLTVPPSPQHEPYLRLCLSCRGYSCPACWNDAIGVCQTCEPLPEPAVVESTHLAAAMPVHPGETEPAAERYEELARHAEPQAEEEPGPEPAAATELEADTGSYTTDWDPTILAEVEPEPVAVAEPEVKPEPVAMAEPVAELGREPEPVAESGQEPEPVAVAEPVAELGREPEPLLPPAPVQPLPPLLPTNPFGPARQLPPPPVRPRIEFDVPPPPAFMIERKRRAPLSPPAVPRPEMGAAAAVPRAKQCFQCQLPLSARANFCRRCGSSQPGPA